MLYKLKNIRKKQLTYSVDFLFENMHRKIRHNHKKCVT